MSYRPRPPLRLRATSNHEADELKEARTYRRIVRKPTPGAFMAEIRLARAADAYRMRQAGRHWAMYVLVGAAETLTGRRVRMALARSEIERRG